MSMKNSNDTIGNRTRDLPAGNTVPEATAPPCAPKTLVLRRYGKQASTQDDGDRNEPHEQITGPVNTPCNS